MKHDRITGALGETELERALVSSSKERVRKSLVSPQEVNYL